MMRVMASADEHFRDLLFRQSVEIGGAFVEQDQSRLTVQSAGNEQALALPSGNLYSHVSDQSSVVHGHGDDFVVDGGVASRGANLVHVDARIEEGDIFIDRAGQ